MTYRRIRFGQIGGSKVIDFAVQELVKYLKQMDPKLVVDVLQLTEVNESFKGLIWVGCDEKLAANLPKVDVPALDDGIAIAVETSVVSIADHADLYAVDILNNVILIFLVISSADVRQTPIFDYFLGALQTFEPCVVTVIICS